jgi:hypothetical protein
MIELVTANVIAVAISAMQLPVNSFVGLIPSDELPAIDPLLHVKASPKKPWFEIIPEL